MKSLFFSFLLVSFAFSLTAQTADEIIAKHLDAIGGKEKISQIKSLYTEVSMDIMGNEAPSKVYIVNGKAYKTELEMMGNSIVSCVTEKGGWSINPMAGSATAEDMPEKQHKSMMDNLKIGGVFMDYAEKGVKVELAGKVKEGGKDAHQLVTTSKEGTVIKYSIDPDTYYILSSETKGDMMGQEVTITTRFSDYKKTDAGYVMAHATEIDFGQFAMTAKVKSVEVNKAIDEAIFAKPK